MNLERVEDRQSLPSGTVTFLFTDIEGSTQLAQENPAEMDALLFRLDAILRQSIEAHHGQIFRVAGDSYAAAFQIAGEALQAAVEAQLALQQGEWDPKPLKVRMGIHSGPAQAGVLPQEPGGYSGYLTLTRAERTMSAAYGGQILLSNASAGLLQSELPQGVELLDMGEHRLKGLLNPERLWQAAAQGLPADFPPLQSLEHVPNNLPVQLSRFIGRQGILAEVTRLVQVNRLVTLTGVGGVGKTRLSLQAAAGSLEAFRDGVWLVELAPLTDPALLPQRLAATLGIREISGRPIKVALIDFLRAKQLLLLLDNCEHVIEACARLAEDILISCPEVHLIASSREALGIPGETIFQLPSMALPGDLKQASVADLASSEAGQLFLERARSIQPGFVLTGQNAPAIAQICQRLDGIPLAIELAAARTKLFSPEQILTRLDDRFRLLTGGSRTALPRQQTLQALIDWSYDLLPEAEQALFRQLSVFAGGWTFEAAEAICAGTGSAVIDLLAHLVDKSLVLVEDREGAWETRYRFLETIRQYASEKLLAAGEAQPARDRQLEFFDQFSQKAEPGLQGADQLDWLAVCEQEHDNLRVALAWGLVNDPVAALRMAGILWIFWNIHGYLREGQDWINRALARVEALPPVTGEAGQQRDTDRVKALFGYGILSIGVGENLEGVEAFRRCADLARRIGAQPILARALSYVGLASSFLPEPPEFAVPSLEESAALSQQIGEHWSLSMTYGMLSNFARARGDYAASSAYLKESYRLSRETGNPWNTAMGKLGIGITAAHQGDFSQARPLFEESLVFFRQIGDKHRTNMALSELAHLERRQGNLDQALALYRETILGWQDLGHRAAVAHQLESIAFIAASQGEVDRALQLLGAAEALRESAGAAMTQQEAGDYDPVVADLRLQSDPSSFALAWEKGREMSMEAAVAFALEPG